MARTALSFAGAAVGFFIGGPAGASWGWAIGSMVGGYVDPQVIQGPKIGETAVQTSRDGVPRPIVYGTAPVVGNIIARGPLEVVKTRQRQGKGGGPVVESEEAYLTFAVRICEGPIQGVLRIWEDEKLVYDVRPGSSMLADSSRYASGFTLYTGSETQLPDPELEAIYGVGNTPAYRGSAYIVFRRKNVTDRRGSVPQLRFEVSRTTAGVVLPTICGEPAPDTISFDTNPESTRVALTNGGLTVQGVGIQDGLRLSTWSRSCAKFYFEVLCESLKNGTPFVGIARDGIDATAASSAARGPMGWALTWSEPGSTGPYASWVVMHNNSFAPGSNAIGTLATPVSAPVVIGCAVDLANGRIWWRVNGTWLGGGDPANGLNPNWDDSAVPAGPDYVDRTISGKSLKACVAVISTASATLRSNVEDMSYVIPDGFRAGAQLDEIAPDGLAAVVADVATRCGLEYTDVDVSELSDAVDGVVIAGLYSGADAIRSLQRPFFFDPCEADGVLRFVKRGGAVSVTLTDDDLIDADEATREQEVEYPRKMHLAYQHANSGYVPTKATVSRSSPDVRVVGEVTVEVPVVLSEDDAAQTCDKMLKIAWVDAKGEVKFSVSDQWLRLTATDCIHLTRRGATRRLRIEKVNLSEGVLQIEAREDRQSAYTSNLSGLQLPAPTPPPSQIPGATHFEFLNLPALRDDDDRLGYYVGAGQILSAWAGAVVELSVGNADDFARVLTVDSGTVFGTLTSDLPAASAEVTDTTNTIHIQVNEDVLESSSQVLNEKNACAIVSANGTEILQFTTATLTGTNTYELAGLVRGGLNTTPVLHASGARFVLLDTAYFVPAGSSLIGSELFHRATSYGNNPDESTVHQDTFSPANTQREWPVYGLTAARDGSDNVTVSWMPRHRFGTAIAPVPSVNFDGWRVTVTKSGTSVNHTIAPTDKRAVQSWTYTAAMATADFGSATGPVTFTVSQLNRITGAGITSEVSA